MNTAMVSGDEFAAWLQLCDVRTTHKFVPFWKQMLRFDDLIGRNGLKQA